LLKQQVLGDELKQDRSWSTSSFGDGAKMARWTDIVSRHMTEMQVNSDFPDHFSARWQQYGLGPVELNFISATPQRCLRSPQMVSRSGEPSYELVFMKSGTMIVTYEHEEEYVPQGSFTLLRNAEPYQFVCEGQTSALTAHFKDEWLRRWLISHENFTRVSHETRRAWGTPLAALLSTIADNGLEDAFLPRSVIADQIGALFALMGQHDGRTLSSHQQALLVRIRSIMRESLEDSLLNPETLASRANVSKRYLHSLFASYGTTFGKELIGMRLERARQMLDDTRYRGRSIAEIAFACGFVEQSHFARRFRHRYGASPTAYRNGAFASR